MALDLVLSVNYSRPNRLIWEMSSINKRTMTITPLRSRTEAINKIPTPKTPKQCKRFCGVVNYLSLFCPDLQTLLKPIVELTRKGRPFIWGDAQEKAFREVKLRLTNPPVLHLPKAEGGFILYSDTILKELVVHYGKFRKVNLS